MNRAKEKGIALILALLLVLVTSVIAVSLASVGRTEAFASMNYRLMSQSRDAAEGGVHKAANFLMYSYSKPGGAGNPLTNYGLTTSPVTSNGNAVVLSANSKVNSNYPVSADQSSFNSAAQGSVTAGNTTINYTTSAQLLSMRQFTPYGQPAGTYTTIQTWAITADGSVSGMQSSDVELTSILEQQALPVFAYAAFATNPGCGALTFGGGGTTDSYDSQNITYDDGSVQTQHFGGNVGTNGNLSTSGNPTTIYGNLSTPMTGVGNCNTSGVTAWTGSSGTVTGSIIELPQTVTYPTPVIPSPGTTDLGISHNATCTSIGLTSPPCYSSGTDIYIPPGNYGNISVTGQEVVHFSPGTYNINSFQEQSAQSGLVIDGYPCASPCVSSIDPNVAISSTNTSVILNVSGNNVSGAVVDLTGQSVQNPSFNPMNLQILYAGTGSVKLEGGTEAAGLVYAPNSSYSFGGGSNWYGAVVGSLLTDMGGTAIHYDRRLKSEGYVAGPYTLGSFSWKKF
jgi:Tfp pilus assembly protein PilX